MPTAAGRRQPKLGKSVIAALVAGAVFAAIAVRPSPARADTEEAFIYAGIGVGIYVTVIVVATLAIYRSATPDSSAIPIASMERDDADSLPVKSGTHCPQRNGQLTLVCW